MPRKLFLCSATATLVLAAALSGPAGAAEPAAPAQPPHAWLFGTWTGGLFPTPSAVTAQACLSQPVVIFTRDVVLRATLTSETYTQRVIESARTSPQGAEFRFAQSAAPETGALDFTGQPSATGFGCADGVDVLQVARKTENEIVFPNCADFPYPLIRCPAR
ncbi:MAG: hypothetical protein JOZ42_13020 [Acetobacteraceae bacterium]|nr:hypothetical protein [Acetobacteraceae bacterium]